MGNEDSSLEDKNPHLNYSIKNTKHFIQINSNSPRYDSILSLLSKFPFLAQDSISINSPNYYPKSPLATEAFPTTSNPNKSTEKNPNHKISIRKSPIILSYIN